ncbi:MAG: sensor domain-containing protein [Acidimicrobiia bacterium]|nr:sensor domain-containing protein [Acidimicrobiia bacterium]
MTALSMSRFLRGSTYGIVGFPMAILWLTIFTTLLSVSGSLLIIGIGFALLSISLRAAGIAGMVERRLLVEILDVKIEQPARFSSGPGFANLILDPLRDSSYWRDLVFIGLRAIVGLLAFAITVAVWLFPPFAFSTIIWGWFVDWEFIEVFATLVAGIGVLISGPFVVYAITEIQVAFARTLLGPGHRQLQEQVSTAQRTRDLSVDAAEAERRRIERDLHDGAQARLATVAMDLGRAKRKLEKSGGDSEIEAIIDAAHTDAKAAIVELRDLARGIHPAVLTDRGLDAALSEIAARCTVPVHLDVQLHQRAPAHIESAAYFAASELLANVSKHSKAGQAWVTVRSDPTHLRIDVSDDGLGGADPAIGTGLDGLHDRLASIDGVLSVHSPLGGGTTALVEIPLNQRAQ